MAEFKGFPDGKIHQIQVPDLFIKDLLPEMNHLGELKICLYIFWRMDHMEGPFRFVRKTDIFEDKSFMAGLGPTQTAAAAMLDESLEHAVRQGLLLDAEISLGSDLEKIYLLNSPKGRAALRAIQSGRWKPISPDQGSQPLLDEPPNIFRLYEENIGPLTPMIAEGLNDAEKTYPLVWIEEAIRISVQNNKRSWRYAETILERWRREGKHGKKEKSEDRPDSDEARRRYVEGEFSDFVEH